MPLISILTFNDSADFIVTKVDALQLPLPTYRIVSHDPTAPSNGHFTSIFGRLGTVRGTPLYF
jgi:hypothetical protein